MRSLTRFSSEICNEILIRLLIRGGGILKKYLPPTPNEMPNENLITNFRRESH